MSLNRAQLESKRKHETQRPTFKASATNQNTMNTKLYLLGVSAAALSLNITTASAQLFTAADVANNRAIAASPRALEQFPWLARQTAKPAATTKSSDTRTALTDVKQNRALAASPRMLEQYPELGRPVQPLRKRSETSVASTAIKNRALAASPRMIEQFPWLARSAEKTFQVAPVK